jgi:protein O-GlcNAc transferase
MGIDFERYSAPMNRQQRRAAAKQSQVSDNKRGDSPTVGGRAGVADLLGAGLTHHKAGRLPEAEACYRQVLAVDPDHADANNLLGAIAIQVGRADLAVELIGRAIQRNGHNPGYFSNLGTALRRLGRFDEAVAAYRRVVGITPNEAEAHYNLATALFDRGDLDESIAACRHATHINPDFVDAYYNLGIALSVQGKLDESIAAYRQAIRIKPNFAEAHYKLSTTLRGHGKIDEAIAASQQAIRIKPDYAEAHCALGIALYGQGRLEESIAAYHQAIRIKPDLAEAHQNLGVALLDQRKLDQAIAACRQAIRLNPDLAEAFHNLGFALYRQGKLDEAIAASSNAIRINGDFADAHHNLGNALLAQGKVDAAADAYRRVIALRPNQADAGSCLLLCMNYDSRLSKAQLVEAHRAWDQRYGMATLPAAHTNDRNVRRRLKVGYVSPDFRHHSVAFFLEPLLRSHDRQEIEVFCYAEVMTPDATTERLKGLADGWLETVGMPDASLAERFRLDGIDILVDLAGHTAHNRLTVFARKPAPIQVTWLGYPNTTGLKAIDYRLVDAVTDPEEEADAGASETLIRLADGFLCYGAPHDAPEPAAPPCLATGTVTFGSFNNPSKLSAATLDTWAMLLARLPDARLLLKGRSFADPATCELFRNRLGSRGIAAERTELVPMLADTAAHLGLYDRIDIALDPFPYNGTTTTCEALWMGVPVITLRGDRHAGRVGASLLTQLGLTELIADSVEEYVEIAVALAADQARLGELHRSLRPRLATSSLGDAEAFARKIESAYRAMWQRWCASSQLS